MQQCDVFGPIFFALGLDELLLVIRARMRNLPVDSTFVGQRVLCPNWSWGLLYWNMRLSEAGAVKDAQVQNDILLISDFTRNLVVAGRQPHPDPNFASSCVLSGRPHASPCCSAFASYLMTLLGPTSWTS